MMTEHKTMAEMNPEIGGGEDAIVASAEKTLLETVAREATDLRSNQQHLVGVLFNTCLALHRVGAAMSDDVKEAYGVAMKVMGAVHHDAIGKTLAEIIRDDEPDEINRVIVP